ncbi:hypothetical protein ABZ372_53495, partial [Streptomyces sp. NPDC005921]
RRRRLSGGELGCLPGTLVLAATTSPPSPPCSSSCWSGAVAGAPTRDQASPPHSDPPHPHPPHLDVLDPSRPKETR